MESIVVAYNTISYGVYISISLYITFWVGKILHRQGEVLMLSSFKKYGYEEWVAPVNNTLLVGYYLLNIGNVLLVITTWHTLESFEAMIATLSQKLGLILMVLGVIHAFNMTVLLIMNFVNLNTKKSWKITQ